MNNSLIFVLAPPIPTSLLPYPFFAPLTHHTKTFTYVNLQTHQQYQLVLLMIVTVQQHWPVQISSGNKNTLLSISVSYNLHSQIIINDLPQAYTVTTSFSSGIAAFSFVTGSSGSLDLLDCCGFDELAGVCD